jgi:hypothetical protein
VTTQSRLRRSRLTLYVVSALVAVLFLSGCSGARKPGADTAQSKTADETGCTAITSTGSRSKGTLQVPMMTAVSGNPRQPVLAVEVGRAHFTPPKGEPRPVRIGWVTLQFERGHAPPVAGRDRQVTVPISRNGTAYVPLNPKKELWDPSQLRRVKIKPVLATSGGGSPFEPNAECGAPLRFGNLMGPNLPCKTPDSRRRLLDVVLAFAETVNPDGTRAWNYVGVQPVGAEKGSLLNEVIVEWREPGGEEQRLSEHKYPLGYRDEHRRLAWPHEPFPPDHNLGASASREYRVTVRTSRRHKPHSCSTKWYSLRELAAST